MLILLGCCASLVFIESDVIDIKGYHEPSDIDTLSKPLDPDTYPELDTDTSSPYAGNQLEPEQRHVSTTPTPSSDSTPHRKPPLGPTVSGPRRLTPEAEQRQRDKARRFVEAYGGNPDRLGNNATLQPNRNGDVMPESGLVVVKIGDLEVRALVSGGSEIDALLSGGFKNGEMVIAGSGLGLGKTVNTIHAAEQLRSLFDLEVSEPKCPNPCLWFNNPPDVEVPIVKQEHSIRLPIGKHTDAVMRAKVDRLIDSE